MVRLTRTTLLGGLLLVVLLAAVGVLLSARSGAVPQTFEDDQTLWAADMEEGSFVDWELGDIESLQNSGDAVAEASQELANDGDWSARLEISAPPESGARLFRWNEARDHRDLYYEAWFYIPESYDLTGGEDTGQFWNIVQFKSLSEDGSLNDPIWHLNVRAGPDGEMAPELVWWPDELEGPQEGEAGYRTFAAEDGVTFPIGRWFPIRARLRQSSEFDGVVQFWLDGEEIFDMDGVRTGYESCRYNDWCVDQAWSVNLYSDGLSPSPSTLYIDDARIQRVEG